MTPTPSDPPPHPTLDQLEQKIINHVANGNTNQAIAHATALSLTTVKLRLKGISRKLGARDRAHAAVLAYQAGYIEPVTPEN